MLVLTRRVGGRVHVRLPDGREGRVSLESILPGNNASLGFEFPRDVEIRRAEVVPDGLMPSAAGDEGTAYLVAWIRAAAKVMADESIENQMAERKAESRVTEFVIAAARKIMVSKGVVQ